MLLLSLFVTNFNALAMFQKPKSNLRLNGSETRSILQNISNSFSATPPFIADDMIRHEIINYVAADLETLKNLRLVSKLFKECVDEHFIFPISNKNRFLRSLIKIIMTKSANSVKATEPPFKMEVFKAEKIKGLLKKIQNKLSKRPTFFVVDKNKAIKIDQDNFTDKIKQLMKEELPDEAIKNHALGLNIINLISIAMTVVGLIIIGILFTKHDFPKRQIAALINLAITSLFLLTWRLPISVLVKITNALYTRRAIGPQELNEIIEKFEKEFQEAQDNKETKQHPSSYYDEEGIVLPKSDYDDENLEIPEIVIEQQ